MELTHRRGLLFVIAAGVLWSTVGLFIRLIEDAGVWQILLYRSVGLTVFLYMLIRWRTGKNPFGQIRQAGLPAVVAALSLVAAYSGAIYAIQTTSVANAMLLFAAAPLLTAVLGWLLLREAVGLVTWGAILVAIGGIAIMVADKTSGGALRGSLAALGSALGFSVFTLALRWGRFSEMLPAVFLSGLFAIVITSLICLATGLSFALSVNDGGIAIGMGVCQVGAGLVLYTLGSKSISAAELALLSMFEVLLGPVWVWFFLGETATVNTLVGGFVLLGAIVGNVIVNARGKRVVPD